jgi:hypothetical protein
MSPEPNATHGAATSRAVCPKCGGAEFDIQGFLGYSQYFDAGLDKYSCTDIDGNCDFATGASCTRCSADVTSVLGEHGVLDFYKIVPIPLTRKAGSE